MSHQLSINVGNHVVYGAGYDEQQRRSSSCMEYGIDRELIQLVRERVLLLIEEEEKKPLNNNDENSSPFDDKDLLHIRETDILITRFILEYLEDHLCDDSKYNEGKLANSVAPCIVDTLKWRKQMNINKTKDSDFPREFYSGGLFAFGEDGHGRMVLYYNGRKVRKLPRSFVPILLRFSACQLEKKTVQPFGNPMNPPLKLGLVFDCGGVSIWQVDLSLALSMIPLMRHHPYTFEYIWCYNIPWTVRPFFNFVLKVLPNRLVKRIQQMDKESAFNEMGPEGIPKFMGGKGPNPRLTMPSDAPTIREVGLRNGISEKDIKAMEKIMAEIGSIDD